MDTEDQDIILERKHPFVWRTLQAHNETALENASCRNSIQGKVLVVDDRGIVRLLFDNLFTFSSLLILELHFQGLFVTDLIYYRRVVVIHTHIQLNNIHARHVPRKDVALFTNTVLLAVFIQIKYDIY